MSADSLPKKIAALERAISIVGGPKALSDLLIGVTPQRVNHWKRRGVPAEYAQSIEILVAGEVPASELCPEVFGDEPRSKLAKVI